MTESRDHNLESLTDGLLASYQRGPQTQRIGHAFLPSRDRIVEIFHDIRRLLFPGFFGKTRLSEQNARFETGSLLSRVYDDLAEQIRYCMCAHGLCNPCHDSDKCARQAKTMAGTLLSRLGMLRDMLALDAQAAYDGDPAAKSLDEIIYCYPGFYAVTVYRVAHEMVKMQVPLMPRILGEHAHSVTGADIHPGAEIGRSFFIDHATGVVIGETTTIGNNVKIYQGVTLGALSFPKDERGRAIKGLKRHPTIEDDVTVYANATILGGQTVIGKGVTVGGNTFVTESITADSLVAQETPRLEVRKKTHKRTT